MSGRFPRSNVFPIIKAKALFSGFGLNFEEQLGWYLANAYVISSPNTFMMLKPIEERVGDDQWMADNPDCWYVHCAVGNLGSIFSHAPFVLPRVAFRRWKAKGNPLRVYDWASLERFNR
jgi:hypothetical protein